MHMCLRVDSIAKLPKARSDVLSARLYMFYLKLRGQQ